MTRRRKIAIASLSLGVVMLAAWFVPVPTSASTEVRLVEPYTVATLRYRSLVRMLTIQMPHSPAPRWGMDYGYETWLFEDGRRVVQVSDLGTVRVREDGRRYAYIAPSPTETWALTVVDVPSGASHEVPLDRWYSKMIWSDPETVRLGYGNPASESYLQREIDVSALSEGAGG